MITVEETALYTLRITDPGDTISITIEFDGELPYTLDQDGSIWTLNVTLFSLVEFNFTVIATDSFNETSAITPQVCTNFIWYFLKYSTHFVDILVFISFNVYLELYILLGDNL